MSADDLIASLRGAGEIDTQGEFLLDRDKAREKMQKFQLEDPYHYILEFVQMGNLLEATSIDFTIDADEVEVVFDGETLRASELEDIYSAVFIKRSDARTQALRHLALGVNASLALDPEVITVESGDGRGPRLELDPMREREELDAEATFEHVGTRIYLKERFRFEHLVEFFRDIRGNVPEKHLLEERVLYGKTPVTIGGRRINAPMSLPSNIKHPVSFETDYEHGVLGIEMNKGVSTVTVCQNGVKIVEHKMRAKSCRVVAIVDSRRLTKNLSQSAFVEDDAWHDLMDNVLRDAMHYALADYFDSILERVTLNTSMLMQSVEGRRAQEVAFEVLDDLASQRDQEVPFSEASRGLLMAISALPLCQLASRHPVEEEAQQGGDRCSLLELRAGLPKAAPLYVAQQAHLDIHVPGIPAVLMTRGKRLGRQASIIERALGVRVEDVTVRLQARAEREENRKRWLHRSVDTIPPSTAIYPYRASFTLPDGIGEGTWSMAKSPNRHPMLRLIKEGRLLRELEIDGEAYRAMSGVCLTLSGDLVENERFNGLADGPQREAMMVAAIAAFPKLLDALGESPGLRRDSDSRGRVRICMSFTRTLYGGRLLSTLKSMLKVGMMPKGWEGEHAAFWKHAKSGRGMSLQRY